MEIYKTFDKLRINGRRAASSYLHWCFSTRQLQPAGLGKWQSPAPPARLPLLAHFVALPLFEQTEHTEPELFHADGQTNTSAVPKTSACILKQPL